MSCPNVLAFSQGARSDKWQGTGSGVGVDDVDDVALGDVARLGPLEHLPVLVEQHAQLDEQGGVRRQVQQPDLERARRAVIVPTARDGTRPSALSSECSELRSRSASRTGASSSISAASSSATGTLSASRTCTIRTTDSSSARPRSVTSCGRGLSSAADSSRELAWAPRRSISSVKERNNPGLRCTGRLATNVPWPRRRSTSPSVVSSASACRTVIRLTLNRSHNSASLGSGSPGWPRSTSERA